MVQAALSQGLQEVAITDHGPASLLFPGEEEDFLSFQEHLYQLREKYPGIRLLMGVEANIISSQGDLDISLGLIQKLDILLAGLHLNIRSSRGFGPFFRTRNLLHSYLSPRLFPGVLDQNSQAVIQALERYPITILTHPGLHFPIDMGPVAQVAAQEGTFMELNARHQGMGVFYLQQVVQAGARLVVNSDAHHPQEVGAVECLYPLIQAADVPEDSFFNLSFR